MAKSRQSGARKLEPRRGTPQAVDGPPAASRAKLFRNGRSQAVRLPKAFRLEGSEVLVRREGRCLVLEPVDRHGWPDDLWPRLDALMATIDDAWQRPSDPPPARIERERDLP